MVQHSPKSGAKSRSGQAEKKPAKSERIAKVLARAGVASRREVERLINLGKVAVNGRILDTPAVLVTRDDIVTVDGKPVDGPEPTRLWRYHKPVGLVTTHRDPEDRPTVFQHLPEGLPRVISIGRLDINSEGLLLLTNDGELSRALELPSTAWKRVYRARAHGRTTQARLDTLKDGITVDEVNYGPIEAKLDKVQEKDDGRANVWITVSLHEGKNREVRRVLEHLGLKVNRLIRLAYGPFQLGALEQGAVEEIGPRVIREQLAEFIEPENLPTGDKVATPVTRPSRRPAPSTRIRPDNAIADPNKKPSRVRAAAEARTAEPERRERPDRHERPARPGGRSERPRGDKPWGDKPRGPRTERPGSDRPHSDRPRSDRPRSDKPWAPRTGGRDAGEGEGRPERFERKPGWAKPRPPREGERRERPAGEAGADDRPIKRADRSFSRNKASRAAEGSAPRAYRGPPRDRGEGGETRERRGPPREGRAEGPRRDGGKPGGGYQGRSDDRGPRGGGDDRRGKPSGAKFGPRPTGKGPRPGGRPGGKPGGKPGGGRGPR
jgi:23S rRNA pseudouridine2605 synthase